MLFDTDILIWYLRANSKAAQAIENAVERSISVISYMELLQGARDKKEIKIIRDFLKDSGFSIIPLTENISHRASVYMEEYCLKVQMSLADALIAATATENNIQLYTGNNKHYKPVKELKLKIFKP
jgi:predicted nucleic acid-binding protein